MRYDGVLWMMLGLVVACGGDDDPASAGTTGSSESGAGAAAATGAAVTGAGGATAASGGASTAATGGGECDVPTEGVALLAWLQAGSYDAYPAESAPHDSAGPHFGNVRVFVNETLRDSLQASAAEHPRCSATVKELFGDSTTDVAGWSVSVKTADTSDGGANWYWFERYNTTEYADGLGVGLCTNCHGAGSDYVRTAFPLQ